MTRELLAQCKICGAWDDPEKTVHPCDECGSHNWRLPKTTLRDVLQVERKRLWDAMRNHWQGDMGPAHILVKDIEHLFVEPPCKSSS